MDAMEIDEANIRNLIDGLAIDNAAIEYFLEREDEGDSQLACWADGMTDDLLTYTIAPASPAKKLKKHPPPQSRPPPTKSECSLGQNAREEYAV